MYSITQIKPRQVRLYEEMNDLFATAFMDNESYIGNRPTRKYVNKLLKNKMFIPLIALDEGKVIGALAAYELMKFEQERSEIYIYDLAVIENYRRKGVATSLINRLKKIAYERGAYIIFVQADTDEEDKPAISLYSKLGTREEVLHFDIEVKEFT